MQVCNKKSVAISVIIPIYNAEKWISQCLDSVIGQALKNIEVLCVDDGSTDNSNSIVSAYAQKDSRIVLIKIKNSGAAEARNIAIGKATGKYVTFLDADDYYPNNIALESMFNAAEEHNVLCCGGLRLWNYDGLEQPAPLHRDFIKKHANGAIIKYVDFQHDYQYHSYIYNLDLIRQHNIKFPNYKRYEDPVFFVDFMVKAKEFYVVPTEVYSYRKKGTVEKLSPQATLDMILGINDNLRTSSKEKLAKLHYTCIQRLNKEYYDDIAMALDSDLGNEIYTALKVADTLQDYELIKSINNQYFTGKKLIPLEDFDAKKISGNNNYIIKKVKGLIKCYKDNGILYTLHRIKHHLKNTNKQ